MFAFLVIKASIFGKNSKVEEIVAPTILEIGSMKKVALQQQVP